jgi:hypothetical protein
MAKERNNPPQKPDHRPEGRPTEKGSNSMPTYNNPPPPPPKKKD